MNEPIVRGDSDARTTVVAAPSTYLLRRINAEAIAQTPKTESIQAKICGKNRFILAANLL